MAGVKIEVSPGELADRLTILEIKLRHITDPAKRRNVEREYAALPRMPDDHVVESLRVELKEVNLVLWRIEDALREHERRQDFGPTFVELARSVYRNNDRRADIKRRINEALGSTMIEEKSYTSY